MALDPSGHFYGKGSKKTRKIIGLGSQAGSIFIIFGLFVESGKQRLDCACAVGLGFWPLVFTLCASFCDLRFSVFFNVFWGTPGDLKSGSAAEPAPPYLISRTTLLCTCTSIPCWGLLLAAWWARPSSPRPDLRRLRRAPGHGRFVHVFWVFVALCTACGVSLALCVALGLHCGTLGFHFDTPEI